MLWDMYNPEDLKRIQERKKAGPRGYRILSLDGGGTPFRAEEILYEVYKILKNNTQHTRRTARHPGVRDLGAAAGALPRLPRARGPLCWRLRRLHGLLWHRLRSASRSFLK